MSIWRFFHGRQFVSCFILGYRFSLKVKLSFLLFKEEIKGSRWLVRGYRYMAVVKCSEGLRGYNAVKVCWAGCGG